MLKYFFSIILFTSVTSAEVQKPKTPTDLQSVTVMITDPGKNGGGTGVIFRSGVTQSIVLTNSHVCDGLETGGLVTTSTGEYPIEQFKRSKVHDICLVQVIADLKYQTILAEKPAAFGEKLRVSGHPYLLPAVTTEGFSSKNLDVTLLVGVEKCTEKEFEEHPFLCGWFGGMPILKTYNAQNTSLMIAPGNSGSGVFNERGQLVGLVFAGVGRGLSPGLIVPGQYINLFIKEEIKNLKWISANATQRLYNETRVNRFKDGYRINKNNIKNIAFPAIRNVRFERMTEKIESCRKGTEPCSLN